MKNLYILFIAVFVVTSSNAQDPNILWQKTIGGSNEDYLSTITTTPDGGYILGGSSYSNISGEKSENSQGENDIWIIKLNAMGNIQWQNTIGGSGGDILSEIKTTPDGGYILGGSSGSNISGDKTENSQGGVDYWILKLNSNGIIEWQNTIGGSEDDVLTSIVRISDGYILGGFSRSGISGDRTLLLAGNQDQWIIRIDLMGNIVWQRHYGAGSNSSSRLNYIDDTSDGGYIAAGFYTPPNGINILYSVLKLDNNGFMMWEELYGGSSQDKLMFIDQTNDGGYILAGFSNSDASGDKSEDSMGYEDYWIVKIESLGVIEWQNTIGGNSQEACYTILQSLEGGYFVSGYSYSDSSGDKTEDNVGISDYWIIKLNSVGIIEWQNSIGGVDSDRRPYAVQLDNGEYVIGGSSKSDISGDKTEDSRGDFDFWILKHNQTLGLNENAFFNMFDLYPNPAQNTLILNVHNRTVDTVKIYSVKGDLVQELGGFEHVKTIDVSQLSSGLYYIQVLSGKDIATKKFIKE